MAFVVPGIVVDKDADIPTQHMATDINAALERVNRRFNDLRQVLSTNRIYYVNATTGNDNNSGLGADVAFKTIQRAIDILYGVDLNNFSATIQCAAGTYAPFSVSNPFFGGTVHVLGDTTTPANVVVSAGAGLDAITVVNPNTLVFVSGVKVVAGHFGLRATKKGTLRVDGKIEFGACSAHAVAQLGGLIDIEGQSYNISGDAVSHLLAAQQGSIDSANATANLNGANPTTYTFAFASAVGGSFVMAFSMRFNSQTGVTSTGASAVVADNGVIQTAGAGDAYFPGNGSVTRTNGGIYS